MNIKEYIESGILEAYVMDALTPEEKIRVSADIMQYPELADEVRSIEQTMIAFAAGGATPLPASMKEQIWDAIVREKSGISFKENGKSGAETVLPFTRPEKVYQIRWQRTAVFIALVGSLLANIILWWQRNELNENQVAVNGQMDSLKQQQQQLALVVSNYHKEQEMMADTAMQPVIMKGMQPGHPMAATIYWRKNSGEAYLSIQKLPIPPTGMQYQLWVIQDGKPVSMGLIVNDIIAGKLMMKIPMQVNNGQAFAISLEKEGGSPSPTMAQIQVLGKA